MKRLTTDEFNLWLRTAYPEVRLVEGEAYKNSRTRIRFASDCGHTWLATPNDVKTKRCGCPTCFGTPRKSLGEVQEFLDASFAGAKLVEGQSYKDNRTKLLITCPKGHPFSITWTNLIKGWRCVTCSGLERWTVHEIVALLPSYGLTLLPGQVYLKNSTPLKWECNYHRGYVFTARWMDIRNRRLGCSLCHIRKFRSEGLVGEMLASTFEVIPQFTICCPTEVRSSGKVRVDFFIPKHNTIVEYQGYQHYHFPNTWHKTHEAFSAQQKRDEWLRQHCEKEGIFLFEIPYFKDIRTEIAYLEGKYA